MLGMLLTLYTTTMRYPMTHEDAGHYASKHPEGTEADSRILAAIKQKLADNHIACAAAHAVAEDLSIPPLQVGLTIDLMEARDQRQFSSIDCKEYDRSSGLLQACPSGPGKRFQLV